MAGPPPFAVDYSWARPDPASMKAQGASIVIRYLTGEGKAIDKGEMWQLVAAGLAVCFCFEQTANDATGGFAAGAANAQASIDALEALGFSDPRAVVVYFAIDSEVNPPDCVPYFQGICSVLPVAVVGVYGEGDLLNGMNWLGLAKWFWESESTSFPGSQTQQPCAHLWQHFDASPIDGTDIDWICKADVGQEPRPVTPTPPPPPAPAPPTEATLKLRVLRSGMTGPDVRQARALLNSHGATLPDSNKYDEAMGTAVVAFKTAAKMNNSANVIGGAAWKQLLTTNVKG